MRGRPKGLTGIRKRTGGDILQRSIGLRSEMWTSIDRAVQSGEYKNRSDLIEQLLLDNLPEKYMADTLVEG